MRVRLAVLGGADECVRPYITFLRGCIPSTAELCSAGQPRAAVPTYSNCGTALAVGLRRQAGDADSGVAFVADVQSDEQGGDLLDDAGIFQSPAVQGTNTGNLGGQVAGELSRVRIVTADDDVAIERQVSPKQLCGKIVKGGDHADLLGHDLVGLLGG